VKKKYTIWAAELIFDLEIDTILFYAEMFPSKLNDLIKDESMQLY